MEASETDNFAAQCALNVAKFRKSPREGVLFQDKYGPSCTILCFTFDGVSRLGYAKVLMAIDVFGWLSFI